MHNLTKIRVYRILLYITWIPALIFVFPLAAIKRRNNSRYFFFFDRYVTGGAQRVHIEILRAIEDIYKQVYFTRYSANDTLKHEFLSIKNTESKDIHLWCDNLILRLFTVHYYSFYINRHKNAVVFSSNSTFFYDMLPFLNKNVITIELLHNFTYGNNGMEFFGLANHKMLQHRLVVDAATKQNIEDQYLQYNVLPSFNKRITMIEPGVPVLPTLTKDYSLPIKILYAGRGTPQKRVHLIDKIATICFQQSLQVEFHFAGTMIEELTDHVKKSSVLYGEISAVSEMNKLYENAHIILMTSAYEGFPMLIKEGMSYGCIPIVTALEGNKSHLKSGYNALLMLHPEDEKAVINEALQHISSLCTDEKLLHTLSENAYKYALENFNLKVFSSRYRDLLTSL